MSKCLKLMEREKVEGENVRVGCGRRKKASKHRAKSRIVLGQRRGEGSKAPKVNVLPKDELKSYWNLVFFHSLSFVCQFEKGKNGKLESKRTPLDPSYSSQRQSCRITTTPFWQDFWKEWSTWGKNKLRKWAKKDMKETKANKLYVFLIFPNFLIVFSFYPLAFFFFIYFLYYFYFFFVFFFRMCFFFLQNFYFSFCPLPFRSSIFL